MEVTEKEVACFARGLEILFNGRADDLGAYDLWCKPVWMGPEPVKDDE